MEQREADIRTVTGVKAHAVTDEGLTVEHADGSLELIPCDSVVLSMGVRPRQKIVDELSGIVDETYVIGDCHSRAGNITSAVREGFFAAMNIQ